MLLQPKKARLLYEVLYEEPTVVQLSALKLTVVRPVQPRKALEPMLVTELGMVTEVRLVIP